MQSSELAQNRTWWLSTCVFVPLALLLGVLTDGVARGILFDLGLGVLGLSLIVFFQFWAPVLDYVTIGPVPLELRPILMGAALLVVLVLANVAMIVR